MFDGISRFICKGKLVYYFGNISIFFEYIVIKEISVIKIDVVVFLEKVCFISCGFFTGYGVVIIIVKVRSVCIYDERNFWYMELKGFMYLVYVLLYNFRKNYKFVFKYF